MKDCPFCRWDDSKIAIPKIPENPQEHLIITIKDNHTHVHGPFSNELVLREMMKAFVAESEKNGVIFNPATEHRAGN